MDLEVISSNRVVMGYAVIGSNGSSNKVVMGYAVIGSNEL